jgi:hypothetical protein
MANTTTNHRFESARIHARNAYAFTLMGGNATNRAEGLGWYPTIAAEVAEVGQRAGWTMPVAASVFSAFSPRCSVAQNRRKYREFAAGGTPAGLSSHVDAARRCVAMGFDGLNGPKTNAFARAVAGDADAVVIDSWMSRMAGWSESPTAIQYRAAVAAIRELAAEWGMEPRAMQAWLWCIERGKAW